MKTSKAGKLVNKPIPNPRRVKPTTPRDKKPKCVPWSQLFHRTEIETQSSKQTAAQETSLSKVKRKEEDEGNKTKQKQ